MCKPGTPLVVIISVAAVSYQSLASLALSIVNIAIRGLQRHAAGVLLRPSRQAPSHSFLTRVGLSWAKRYHDRDALDSWRNMVNGPIFPSSEADLSILFASYMFHLAVPSRHLLASLISASQTWLFVLRPACQSHLSFGIFIDS